MTAQDAVTSFGSAYVELECLIGRTDQPFLVETLLFASAPVLVLSLMWVYLRLKKDTSLVRTTTVVVFFLLQPTLTKRTMLLFSCIRLGSGAEDFFLTADLATRCWSGEHMTLVLLVGTPMLLFYMLGIPLGLFLLLFRNRDWVLAQPVGDKSPEQASFHRNYSFLWDGYQVDTFHHASWEVVMVCRKTLLNVVAVFFAFNAHAQAVAGFVVIFLATLTHARAYPFAEPRLNHLELGSLCCTVHASNFGVNVCFLDVGLS